MTVTPLGDSAALITISDLISAETSSRVRTIAAEIRHQPPPGTVDVVPAFGRIAVFFDPVVAPPFEVFAAELVALADRADAAVVSAATRTVEIPVHYGGSDGPDLDEVARRAQRTPAEAASLHASAEYLVHAIGFAPGFPYLGGLPPSLETPRRATPRPRVPAGSVGIGGVQTGIYPLETPGGWNLIGRTPLRLFDPGRSEPSLLRAGDKVRFRAVTEAEAARSMPREATADSPSLPESEGGANPPGRIEVLRAGMFTTIQDLGRRGHRAEGVPLSGAVDAFSLRVANLLVGNAEDAAALEFTLVGPELRFDRDVVVAFGGAEIEGFPRWRPLTVRAGEVLRLGPVRHGCRGYLAVAGGIDVPRVLGSRSTYVRANLGGWQGRRLFDGDCLAFASVARTFRNHWHIDERILPRHSVPAVVRFVPGEQAGEFPSAWSAGGYKASTQFDRMGVRLVGPALQRASGSELISSPVAPGTVQVPPDGQPIVLLADAQTIGGYPQLAHVIAVDLPVVAQLRPGDDVRFQRVTLEQARELAAAQERAVGLLREGLAQKLA